MKKFTIILLTLIASTSFAQNAPIDFEPGGHGADWTWTVFENDTNPPLEIIPNPDPSGINTSSTVAKFTALQSGNPWAGCESQHGADLGAFVLDETNSIIKIMVWKPVISDVGIKLVSALGWALPEIKVANTLVNQWEELTFDFSAYPNPPAEQGPYDQIVVFPDFDLSGRTQDNICYFDNITFNPADAMPEIPPVAAPTPPARDPNDVISIFSEAYANVPGTDFNPNWGQSTVVSIIEIEGNETLRYANFNYQGTQFAQTLDVTGMEFLHLDMWTADATSVNVYCISPPDETPFALPITPGQWVSYDIPLSAFSGVNLAELLQFKFDGGNGSQTIYLDNIYFYVDGDLPTEPAMAAPTPPARDPGDVVSIFSDAYANVPGTDFNPNWGQSTVVSIVEIQGNETLKYANFNYQGTQFAQALDVTGMEFLHLDMWTADATSVNVYCISPPDETPFALPITPGQWVSYDIPLSAFSGVNMAELLQFKFDGGDGSQTIYLDNIYFYKDVAGPGDTPRNPIDFEPGGYGADWTWTVFENNTNPPLEIIANPDPSGINTSATVAKFTALQAGQPWAGVESAHGDSDLGPFVLDATNSIIKIMVWKPVISDVGIKLAASSGWAQPEIKVPNTLVNQWEELSFDFSGVPNPPASEGMYDQIIIFPDFAERGQDNVIYFDNITFNQLVGTNNLTLNNRTKVYPNPVMLGGQVQLGSDVKEFELLDLSGRVLISANNPVVETDKLSRGIYILRIHTKKGEVDIQKLVVN